MSVLNRKRLKEVTSVKLFKDPVTKYEKYKHVDQEGLLSEVIFGPRLNYKCCSTCGKQTSKTNKGQVCKKCGVLSTTNITRYKFFGKITLPIFVIRTTKKPKLKSLVKKDFNHILDPKRNDLTSSLKSFIKYDKFNPDNLEIVSEFNPENCIPLNITGIFSLYLSLNVAANHLGSSKAKEYLDYFYNELLVVPPNCRLTVIGSDSGKKKLIINDLDDIYGKILYISNAISANTNPAEQIEEFNNMIINTIEAKMLDYIDDPEIQNFDQDSSRLQFRCDSVYEYVSEQLSGKEGLIRKDYLGRSIDFSARAVIIPDPTLDTYQVKIPDKMFIRLWMLDYSRWLQEVKAIPFEKIRLFVRSTDIYNGYLEYVDEFIDYFFEHSSQKERLVMINRQPSLWRYSLSTVEIIGVTKENTINISPISVKPFNADFDGDTFGLYRIHALKAIDEMYDNSFLLNTTKYDHTDKFMHHIMNEAKYCYGVLIQSNYSNPFNNIKILSLDEMEIDYERPLTDCYIVGNNHISSYGVALINKFAGFKTIHIDANDTPETVSTKIYIDSADNKEYHRRLNELNNSLNWFLTAYSKEMLTLPFTDSIKEMKNSIVDNIIEKLPKNPHIGHVIFNAMIDKSYDNMDNDNRLYKLKLGKFNKKQYARSIIGIGYISDDNNIIQDKPITGTLLGGLSEDQFFETCFGSRKGIVR